MSYEASPNIIIKPIVKSRYTGVNMEIREFICKTPEVEEKNLDKFYEKCLELFVNSLLNISNDFTDTIIVLDIKKKTIRNSIIRKYTEFLLTVNFTSVSPEELYKIIFDEITISDNSFSVLKKIKNTELYKKIKKFIGNKSKIADEMGDLGF